MRSDLPLPEVFTRADAAKIGLTRHQVTSRLKSGRWVALRRGVFCSRETFDACPPNRRHLLHAVAARLAHQRVPLAESHLTAAGRWGLPMPLDGGQRAYLTDGCTTRSTRLDASAVIEVATLFPGDVCQRSGVPLTTPTRTVADCLRHHDPQESVPVADAAIERGLTSTTAVAALLDVQSAWPYGLHGVAALAMVDGRRESWLESISSVRLRWVGIAPGEPQVEVYDASGTLIGRVDTLWAEQATVGEADGAEKYSLGDWPDLAQASGDELVAAHIEAGRRVVRDEKIREDKLREVGLEIVRWGTADIMRKLSDVARRITAAQGRGDLTRFAGHFRSTPTK
jgi:hypothetical protein